MTRMSVKAAEQEAAMMRRAGYPEAQAAPDYCIDGVIGHDNFYTYTVSVYAGPHHPEATPDFIKSAMAKTKARFGIS